MSVPKAVRGFIDENRLLVAVGVFWSIVASLLYFSQIGVPRCLSIRDGVWTFSDNPAWVDAWFTLSMWYVDLYDFAREAGDLSCSTTSVRVVGYLSFVALPMLVLVAVVWTAKWVRRA